MAKKNKGPKHKAGDTVTDEDGTTWTFTKGKNWKDSDGKLFNKGKGGAPKQSTLPPGSTYNDALNAIGGDKAGLLGKGLKDIAGGDKALEKGFRGGAEIGGSLFATGSLGRVDEKPSQDQLDIQAKYKNLSEPNVDPLLQGTYDRANKTADDAQTLDPELSHVLDLRKAALGGLNTDQLLATKELAQQGFDQSLTSAVRALRVGNGPRGAAGNIGTVPLTAQYANSQANLDRQLILDQYGAQKDALNSYAGDAKDIVGGFQANRIAANNAAGTASVAAINDRATRFNSYVNYNSALRTDQYGRQLQNLNAIAAEKSGQAASIFGGGSFAAQQQGEKKSFELGKQNLALQKDIFGKEEAGGGESEESSAASPGDGNSDVFG